MAMPVEAVFEQGVFRPTHEVGLREGQKVMLSVEPVVTAPDSVEAQLAAWRSVYAGLSEDDIAEVERLALDRTSFSRERSPRQSAA